MRRTFRLGLPLDVIEIALEEIALVQDQQNFSNPVPSVTLNEMMTPDLRVPHVHPFPTLLELMLREPMISRRVLFVPTTVLIFDIPLSTFKKDG